MSSVVTPDYITKPLHWTCIYISMPYMFENRLFIDGRSSAVLLDMGQIAVKKLIDLSTVIQQVQIGLTYGDSVI